MKKDYSLIKTLLFAAGLVIIVAAAILFYPLFPVKLWKHILLWFNIAFVYCAALLPVVIHRRNVSDGARVFVGGAIYYRGVAVYAVIAAVLLVFAFRSLRSPVIYIIAQCVIVLIFLIYLFAACFTAGHIAEIENEETDKLAMVNMLRAKSAELAVKAGGLGDEYAKVKEAAERFKDNMRYLSPSNDPGAAELERKMAVMIDSISADPVFSFSMNSSAEPVMKKFGELNVLYEQRKIMI